MPKYALSPSTLALSIALAFTLPAAAQEPSQDADRPSPLAPQEEQAPAENQESDDAQEEPEAEQDQQAEPADEQETDGQQQPDQTEDAAPDAQQQSQPDDGQPEGQEEQEQQDQQDGQEQPQQQQQQQQAGSDCPGVPDHEQLTTFLQDVVAPGDPSANGGLGNHMWAVVVNRGGVVCAVARSGEEFGDQWPGSRAIAVSKANTANAFSLPGFALSTANLYWPSQPGQALYGLETPSPVAELVYEGSPEDWGTANDPLVGQPATGITVFGGGLALYHPDGVLVGALGLSGDESCTDHVIAWRMRESMGLDAVPDGVSDAGNDNMIHDITTDPATGDKTSQGGYGHPTCSPAAERIVEEDLE